MIKLTSKSNINEPIIIAINKVHMLDEIVCNTNKKIILKTFIIFDLSNLVY